MRTGLAGQKVSDKRRIAIGLTRPDLGIMIPALRTQPGHAGSVSTSAGAYPSAHERHTVVPITIEVVANGTSPSIEEMPMTLQRLLFAIIAAIFVPAAAAGENIKIGFPMPLSGPASVYGVPITK